MGRTIDARNGPGSGYWIGAGAAGSCVVTLMILIGSSIERGWGLVFGLCSAQPPASLRVLRWKRSGGGPVAGSHWSSS
jgi:hypothetical protein